MVFHQGAGRRARLTAPGHLDVGPPVRGRSDDRRRLLPQLLIVGLAEHHRPADTHAPGDRADDLDARRTFWPRTFWNSMLRAARPCRGAPRRRSWRPGTARRPARTPGLRTSRHGAGRPGRQQLGKALAGLPQGGLVQAAGHLAVARGRRRPLEVGEHLYPDRAVGPLAEESEDARRRHVDKAVELAVAVGVEQPDLGAGGGAGRELRRPAPGRSGPRSALSGAISGIAPGWSSSGAELPASSLHRVVEGRRHVLTPDAGHVGDRGLAGAVDGRQSEQPLGSAASSRSRVAFSASRA